MQHRHTNQKGFTLVELLIATTVFSVILMAAASTLIQIGRMYYKGVITAKTQNIARTVIDDVSRTIQFSNGSLMEAPAGDLDPKAYCVGTTRYTYIIGRQVSDNPTSSQTRHALWQDSISDGGCDSQGLPNLQEAVPSPGGRELLEEGMRLQAFNISSLEDNDVFSIAVKVIYGDDDLLNDPTNPTACKGSVVGGQWCAISDLSTVVYSRARAQ